MKAVHIHTVHDKRGSSCQNSLHTRSCEEAQLFRFALSHEEKRQRQKGLMLKKVQRPHLSNNRLTWHTKNVCLY